MPRGAAKESLDTPIRFMLVDHHFTRTLRVPWPVNVPVNGSVLDFLGKITVLEWDELDSVLDAHLKVWKLPIPQPARIVMNQEYLASVKPREEVETEGRRRGRGPTTRTGTGKGKGKAKEKAKQVKVVEQLLPSDEMLLYVKGPAPQNRISVLVQLPPAEDEYPSKRRRLADSHISSWFKDVRPQLWNSSAVELELFRKVKITRAHYTQLQERLKAQHPDRDSKKYDALNHNVQNIKLDFLLTAQADDDDDSEASNDDNSEMDDDGLEVSDEDDELESSNEDDELVASNEDKFNIDLLFPFTLHFLDLSTLGLKKAAAEGLPLPLFLRQEYNHLSALIDGQPQCNKGSVVISGQPGTGKTALLHLMIIRCMIKGRPFLYQDRGGNVCHVNQKGVEVITSWSSEEGITAFVDGDKKNHEPDFMLTHPMVQIVLASPPKGAHQPWMKQIGRVKVLATKLWSCRELLLSGIFLYPFDISLKLLRESTLYFGYNPRLCFNAAHSVDVLEMKKEVVMLQIRDVSVEEGNMSQLLRSSLSGDSDSDVAHSFFVNFPRNKERLFAQCNFGGVSPWALDHLLDLCETQRADAAAEFYKYIQGASEAASLWGHVFKRLVLNYFDGVGPKHKFSLRELTSSEEVRWSIRPRIRRFNFRRDLDFIDEITKAVREKKPLHLVPFSRNYAAVDSIIYDPNGVLTCIQVTARREHDILVSGLERIQSWLRRGTLLEGLHPSENRPWRFIFIVPSDEETFDPQRLVGDTAQGEWAGKVQQYVLGLDVVGEMRA